MKNRRTKISLITLVLAAMTSSLHAVEVTMSSDSNNELRVKFTAPIQNVNHNAIQLQVSTSTPFGTLTANASIYEDGVEIGSGPITDSISARFADSTSRFANDGFTSDVIDFFGTIADGVSDGEIVINITGQPGSTIRFNTDNISIRTFGDGGGFPASFPVVTSVVVGDAVTSIDVGIDIKPGSDPNSINLCSNGAVPVAIFGSSALDVTNINTENLRFAEASVKVVGKKDPSQLCSYEDINGDFISDLVCHFVTTDIAGIDGESTTATVNGELFDGTTIEGTDSVNIVKDTCN